jgi:hypothetical protein
VKEIYQKATFRAKAVTGPAVYYLGIVDFLQDWTTKKKIERLFKIYFGRKDPDGLSVMEPIAYMERFQNKMIQIFDVEVASSVRPVDVKQSTEKTSNQEAMKIGQQQLHGDDVVVKKHYAYTVLQDETSNPLVEQIHAEEETKKPQPAIHSLESPPKRKTRESSRSIGSGSNYGDDASIVSETERLRRGLNPAVAADPYQYVYDVISSENSPASARPTVEEEEPSSAMASTSDTSPSTNSNSAADIHPKNTEFNDYIEL